MQHIISRAGAAIRVLFLPYCKPCNTYTYIHFISFYGCHFFVVPDWDANIATWTVGHCGTFPTTWLLPKRQNNETQSLWVRLTCKNCIHNFSHNNIFLPELRTVRNRPVSIALLSSTLSIKPNTQARECYLFRYIKLFSSAEWWSYFYQQLKFHFPIFLLPKPKVMIYSVSVY